MTYLTFHLLFLVPPIAVMLGAHQRPRNLRDDARVDLALPLICIIAFSYTTPWDNYLVAKEVWWYGPDRVIGTIGYVPLEEYMFFLLQPILTGLFLYQCLGRFRFSLRSSSGSASWLGFGLFGGLGTMGGIFLWEGTPSTLYLALILVWAAPILAGMWLYDGETLWALRSTVAVATGVPTLYLWVADAVAIRSEIWTISPEYTTGIAVFGLPLEEASFFLFTNLLVVQGLLLLLYGSHQVVSRQEPLAQSAP